MIAIAQNCLMADCCSVPGSLKFVGRPAASGAQRFELPVEVGSDPINIAQASPIFIRMTNPRRACCHRNTRRVPRPDLSGPAAPTHHKSGFLQAALPSHSSMVERCGEQDNPTRLEGTWRPAGLSAIPPPLSKRMQPLYAARVVLLPAMHQADRLPRHPAAHHNGVTWIIHDRI
jgi:hypothetical protein